MSDATGVPHTCPTIDSIISSAKDAISYLKSAKKLASENYVADEIDSAIGYIDSIIDEIEEVRDHNLSLRDFALVTYNELQDHK